MGSSATCVSAAMAQSNSPARRLQPRLCVSTHASHTDLVTPPKACRQHGVSAHPAGGHSV